MGESRAIFGELRGEADLPLLWQKRVLKIVDFRLVDFYTRAEFIWELVSMCRQNALGGTDQRCGCGAGVIGKRHIREIVNSDQCKLSAIVDPSPEAKAFVARCSNSQGYRELFERDRIDAVIVCTPNDAHAEVGLACIDKGIPVLIEMPIAGDLRSALADAS